MATLCPQRGFPSQHPLQETNGKNRTKAEKMRINIFSKFNILMRPPSFNIIPHKHIWKDSRLRYSSIDRAYFFQDLRSDALKAISWPSRCGAIVIPASGDPETVNCTETQGEVGNRRTAGEERRGQAGVIVEASA